MNPEIKIILIVCDPVNRSFSDFVHATRIKEYPNIVKYIPTGNIDDENLLMINFEKFINEYLEKIETKRNNLN